jgi:hypothetical protein
MGIPLGRHFIQRPAQAGFVVFTDSTFSRTRVSMGACLPRRKKPPRPPPVRWKIR